MKAFLNLKKRLLIRRYSKEPAFKRFFSDVNLSTPIKEVTFVVFDTETTGTDPGRAELVSIGALKVRSMEIDLSTAFHRFVKPSSLTRTSVEIHGITLEELSRKGEDELRVVEDFLDYIRGSVLVGFNVRFDVKMIEKVSLRHFRIPILNYRVDVFHLWRRSGKEGKSLKEIAYDLDVPTAGIHSALDDAYITALVFLKLTYRMRDEPLSVLPLML